MNVLITFIFFGLCIFGMAIGYVFSRKALRKGCSDDPESCACRTEGKDPNSCNQ